VQPVLQQPVPVSRRAAAIDLTIALAFFLICNAAEPALDPVLRRGHGLAGVLALAAYQFTLEGLAGLVIIAIRHERFSQYGFNVRNLGKSLLLAFVLAGTYDLALSLHAGALQWVPLRRQPAVRMSLAAGFPLSVLGLAVTIVVWGFFEGFFGVFFARKLNQALGNAGRSWFSPGALGFALFNGLIHLAIGHGIQGFVFSFASGYAIAVIPAVTGNAWGGPLVQALTNAAGKL
jgi:hypothetical protein